MASSRAHPPGSLAQLLYARTPRVVVTPAIIAVDVALFAAMAASSGAAVLPGETLIAWGAQFAPAIADGEWWRLFTAMWLHGHPPHLILNGLVLWHLGAIVERLLGPLVFLIVFVLTGLIASVASLEYHGAAAFSVGASGAIFGIAGVLLAVAFTAGEPPRPAPSGPAEGWSQALPPWPVEPPPLPRPPTLDALLGELRGSAITFVLYNVIAGLVLPRVDNAAHLGGLAGGVAIGWLVGRHGLQARPRLVHTVVPIALTAALVVVELQRVPALQDHRDERDRVLDEMMAPPRKASPR
jgi:rhomboid protease GluP